MESPLSAREFLRRFHLPQLVRISGFEEHSEQLLNENEKISTNNQDDFRLLASSGKTAGKSFTLSNHLNLSSSSISSSFVAINSDLNANNEFLSSYKPKHCFKSQAELISRCRDRERENESINLAFSSLMVTGSESNNQRRQLKQNMKWSSNEANRFLNDHHQEDQQDCRLIRVPRASLINNKQPARHNNRGAAMIDFESAEESKLDTLESIRLTPPSRRITFNKLSLNQPFLLYKAYKKLELSAYLIDSKNELNEKSGDPIYFPQNYPGEFKN